MTTQIQDKNFLIGAIVSLSILFGGIAYMGACSSPATHTRSKTETVDTIVKQSEDQRNVVLKTTLEEIAARRDFYHGKRVMIEGIPVSVNHPSTSGRSYVVGSIILQHGDERILCYQTGDPTWTWNGPISSGMYDLVESEMKDGDSGTITVVGTYCKEYYGQEHILSLQSVSAEGYFSKDLNLKYVGKQEVTK